MWVLFLFEHRHLKVFARWFLKLFTSGLNVCSSANIIKWVFLGTGSFSSILEFLLQAYFGRKNYLLLFSIPPPPLLIPSYSFSALPSGNAVQNQVLDKVSLSSCLYVTMWLLQIQSLSQKFGLVSVRLYPRTLLAPASLSH